MVNVPPKTWACTAADVVDLRRQAVERRLVARPEEGDGDVAGRAARRSALFVTVSLQ